MNTPILTLENILLHQPDTAPLLNHLSLQVSAGDFIMLLGNNQEEKQALFASITGQRTLAEGTVLFGEQRVNTFRQYKRAQYCSQVLADPAANVATHMTVAENLLLAYHRGKKKRLLPRRLKEQKIFLYMNCKKAGIGLEEKLDLSAKLLSHEQRQMLSLLMATILAPQLLLLEELTAALRLDAAQRLMQLTQRLIEEKQLTCLMSTNRIADALAYGNRLLILQNGNISHDLSKEEKAKLTLPELFFLLETT